VRLRFGCLWATFSLSHRQIRQLLTARLKTTPSFMAPLMADIEDPLIRRIATQLASLAARERALTLLPAAQLWLRVVGTGRGENDECTTPVVAALRAIIPMK
jgi:hypothetical protein